MAKLKTKVEPKDKKVSKILTLPISKFIDTGFRDYALYVLMFRGIPAFEDGLTPVQRYILDNCPQTISKTLSVVGKCIEAGYHHGNTSLEKATARLARPFGSSFQILEGHGFFGTEVSPEPAAARYTSVKLGPKSASILHKYKYLFTKDEDGANDPFWLDLPIGLTTLIVGIAVGYKSTVLPRKLEDIQDFLQGKKKTLKPYFNNFNGDIKKYNNLNKAWIITSNITVKDNRIEIRELPPIMKYSSVLSKIDWLFSKYDSKIKFINNSNTKVNIDIIYTGRDATEFEEIKTFLYKTFSIIVTESLVFIKDGKVLVYDTIEEYLEDYKWQIYKLDLKNKQYEQNWTNTELEFNKGKKKFIEFIISKKRTVLEIDNFLKDYPDFKSRLEGLTSKKFTDDELKDTILLIKKLTLELKERNKLLKEAEKKFNSVIDPTLKRGISSKNNSGLFDIGDLAEDNGIVIWDGDELKDTDE